MLQALIRMLTSPIKFKKERPPAPAQKKHLVMQTRYTPTPHLLETSEMLHIDIELLIKQQQLLLAQPAFADAVIEIHLLDKNTSLLGFTRHPQTILNVIFMYPKGIESSDKWDEVINHANEHKIGVAVFKLRQDIDCLKATQNDRQKSTLYLVDHRAIAAIEMMHSPA